MTYALNTHNMTGPGKTVHVGTFSVTRKTDLSIESAVVLFCWPIAMLYAWPIAIQFYCITRVVI